MKQPETQYNLKIFLKILLQNLEPMLTDNPR